MSTTKERIWIQCENVVTSPLGDRLALLDTRNNIYYSLEGIGPLLWESLGQGYNPSQLSSLVQERFSVDADMVRTDIAAWIAEMAAAGLIVELA